MGALLPSACLAVAVRRGPDPPPASVDRRSPSLPGALVDGLVRRPFGWRRRVRGPCHAARTPAATVPPLHFEGAEPKKKGGALVWPQPASAFRFVGGCFGFRSLERPQSGPSRVLTCGARYCPSPSGALVSRVPFRMAHLGWHPQLQRERT